MFEMTALAEFCVVVLCIAVLGAIAFALVAFADPLMPNLEDQEDKDEF